MQEQFAISHQDLKQPLAPDQLVSITNPLGDVRLRASSVQEVRAAATVQSLAPGQETPEIRAEPEPSGLRIIVDHPSIRDFDGRVDLGVTLPGETATDVRTQSGLIEARGLSGSMMARSTSGDLSLMVSGALDAATDEGAIFAWIQPNPQQPAATLETATGNVTVRFSAPADMTIEVSTGGVVSLGSSIEGSASERLPASDPHVLRFGEGTRQVRIASRSGNVRIVVDEPAESMGAAVPREVPQDLRNLPDAPAWQPGQPIIEVPRGGRPGQR